MGIINSLQKIFKKETIPQHSEYYTMVFNQKCSDIESLFENVFPWSDIQIENSNLVISDIILLWVINRLHDDFKQYPKYLEKNYGITNLNKRIKKLIDLNLINTNYDLTDLGTSKLNTYYKYIILHKNDWTSDTDREINRINYYSRRLNHINTLEKMGMKNEAIDLQIQIENDLKNDAAKRVFDIGETLSKNKMFYESNVILLPLLEDEFVRFLAPLYERIAKNYRGLKEYQMEIDICTYFLSHHQQKYGLTEWKEVFEKRMIYAHKKLISKNN